MEGAWSKAALGRGGRHRERKGPAKKRGDQIKAWERRVKTVIGRGWRECSLRRGARRGGEKGPVEVRRSLWKWGASLKNGEGAGLKATGAGRDI